MLQQHFVTECRLSATPQARRLDKYLYRKSRQAAGKIGINDSDLRKSVARNRVTYLEKVKEKKS